MTTGLLGVKPTGVRAATGLLGVKPTGVRVATGLLGVKPTEEDGSWMPCFAVGS